MATDLIPDNIRLLIEQAKTDPYVFGVLPSEVKEQDYAVAPIPGTAPESYSLGALGRFPVMNQMGGTCTGHAVGAGMTYLQYEDTRKIVLFDGEELHNRVVPNLGHGAMPRDVLDEVRHHGAHARAGLHFLSGYAEVNWNDREQMKGILGIAKQPLVLAVWCTRAFMDLWGLTAQRFLPPAPGEDFGYHAVLAVGYTPEGLIIQNSWSRFYGFQGTIGLTWDYLAAHAGQAWTMTDKPDAAEGFVQHYRPVVVNDGSAPARVARRGGMPAVWAIYDGGRMWVQSKTHAAQMAVDLRKVEALPATDEVWSLPIVGKVPPGESNV